MVSLIHLITLEVNCLSTLLHLVAIHTWRGLIGGDLGFQIELSSLGHSSQVRQDYFIVDGEVVTLFLGTLYL